MFINPKNAAPRNRGPLSNSRAQNPLRTCNPGPFLTESDGEWSPSETPILVNIDQNQRATPVEAAVDGTHVIRGGNLNPLFGVNPVVEWYLLTIASACGVATPDYALFKMASGDVGLLIDCMDTPLFHNPVDRVARQCSQFQFNLNEMRELAKTSAEANLSVLFNDLIILGILSSNNVYTSFEEYESLGLELGLTLSHIHQFIATQASEVEYWANSILEKVSFEVRSETNQRSNGVNCFEGSIPALELAKKTLLAHLSWIFDAFILIDAERLQPNATKPQLNSRESGYLLVITDQDNSAGPVCLDFLDVNDDTLKYIEKLQARSSILSGNYLHIEMSHTTPTGLGPALSASLSVTDDSLWIEHTDIGGQCLRRTNFVLIDLAKLAFAGFPWHSAKSIFPEKSWLGKYAESIKAPLAYYTSNILTSEKLEFGCMFPEFQAQATYEQMREQIEESGRIAALAPTQPYAEVTTPTRRRMSV